MKALLTSPKAPLFERMKNMQKKVRICRTIFDAVRINDVLAVEVFLIFGASVNMKDTRGWTPLHFAAWHNHGEIFSFLLSKGANPNALTFAGERPIDLALRNNASDIPANPELMKKTA